MCYEVFYAVWIKIFSRSWIPACAETTTEVLVPYRVGQGREKILLSELDLLIFIDTCSYWNGTTDDNVFFKIGQVVDFR